MAFYLRSNEDSIKASLLTDKSLELACMPVVASAWASFLLCENAFLYLILFGVTSIIKINGK